MGRVDFDDGSFAEVRKAPKGKFFLLVAARTPGEEEKGDIINSAELSKAELAELLGDIIVQEETVPQPAKKPAAKKTSKKKASKKNTTTKKATKPTTKEM